MARDTPAGFSCMLVLCRVLCGVLCCIVVALLTPDSALAQQLSPEDQPDFVARSVAFTPDVRVFANPLLPLQQTGLVDLSTRELVNALTAQLIMDRRYDVVDRDEVLGRMLDDADPVRTRYASIGRRSVAAGIEAFQSYNLEDARNDLESGLRDFSRTFVPWTDPDLVADAHEYLTLVHVERGRISADSEVESAALAQQSLREMIRLDPSRVFSDAVYPRYLVEAFQQAYIGHLAEDGDLLRLSSTEASRLARDLGVDTVVDLILLTDANGTRALVDVFDTVTQRFVLSEEVDLGPQPDTTTAIDRLSLIVSDMIACLPYRVPPPGDGLPDQTRPPRYLGLMYSNAYYLQALSQFDSHGFAADATFLLSDTVGFYVATNVLYGTRDREGDLLGRVDTLRIGGGLSINYHWARARIFLALGPEVARVSRTRLTSEYWCKVSGGEPFSYDDERECEEADIANLPPQIRTGSTVHLGGSFRIAGPFWLHAQTTMSLYLTPLDRLRSVDFPFGGEVGILYQF